MKEYLTTENTFGNTRAICLITGKHLKINPPKIILDPAQKWEYCLESIKGVKNTVDIAISFLTFTDGRGYSIAARIKEKKLIKNIHAVGKITEELGYFLKRSGFDIAHFPLRENSITNKKILLKQINF
jgi:uncharacterized protein (DUF934 family)